MTKEKLHGIISHKQEEPVLFHRRRAFNHAAAGIPDPADEEEGP
jgi:hypothetical protein